MHRDLDAVSIESQRKMALPRSAGGRNSEKRRVM